MAEEAGARLDLHRWICAVGWEGTGPGNQAPDPTHPWLSHRDLHSYLLGDHADQDDPVHNNNNRFPAFGDGLHAAHQALLQQGGPVGFRPYHRPVHFPLKVCDFLFLRIDEKPFMVERPAFTRLK